MKKVESSIRLGEDAATRLIQLAGVPRKQPNYLSALIRRQARYHTLNSRIAALEGEPARVKAEVEDSAEVLRTAVKNVGQALAACGDKIGCGKLRSELYQRYSLPCYKALPRAQYEAVLGASAVCVIRRGRGAMTTIPAGVLP